MNWDDIPRDEELEYNVYELLEKENELEIPTEEELFEDDVRNHYVEYEEWREYMYEIERKKKRTCR